MRARANYDKVFEVLKNIIKGTPYENHVFTVGGCERDRIIGGIVKDVDIAVPKCSYTTTEPSVWPFSLSQ